MVGPNGKAKRTRRLRLVPLARWVRRLLEEIVESAQEHPLFLGWQDDISAEDVDHEGGDAAFITADVAWKAKKALELLDA